MRIRLIGHAGLEIETSRGNALIDPWFSPQGAFQAAWFPYPDNAHLLESALFEPGAIALSHPHQDHLDPWFLEQVPPAVPIFIPRYPSRVMRNLIEATGHERIVELDPWQTDELLPGIEVFFIPEESPMNHDAAIVVTADGKSLVDLNDARIGPDQARAIRQRVGGSPDVLAFQGAGASWYPIVYDYTDAKMRELSARKRYARFEYATHIIELLDPGVAVPFAGPPCFLDPELQRFNSELDQGIFPDQAQVRQWLRGKGFDRVEVLLPGDRWDTETRAKLCDPEWGGFSFSDRREYLDRYATRRAMAVRNAKPAPPDHDLFERFQVYFERLLGLSPYFNSRIDMRVGFTVRGLGGGDWAVDFRPGREAIDRHSGECGYRIALDSRWLPSILDGAIPWEDFFLSLRFSASRDPGVYNDHLLGLLKFADKESLLAVERYETSQRGDDTISVEADGRTYQVQRYCPHAGTDLLDMSEILPGGIIRCLAHHYEFDLETGKCANGSIEPLSVRPAEL